MRRTYSRRDVLRYAGAGLGTAALLGACSGDDASPPPASAGDQATSLGVPTSVGPGATAPPPTDAEPAIPDARVDRPVTLPDNGAEPVSSTAPIEPGPLRILIYPDYLNPDVQAAFEAAFATTIELTYYDELEQLVGVMGAPGASFDLLIGPPAADINGYVLGATIQPLNLELIPNSANVLAGLRDPYYDQGSKYSIPYSVYTTGITYRRDIVGEDLFNRDDAWAILWDANSAGKVGLLPDVRDGMSLGLLVNGVTDLNTSDPAAIAGAGAVLERLVAAVQPVFDVYSYESIPSGAVNLHQAWSGDMLTARSSYLAEGQTDEILGYWHPTRAPVTNDLMLVPSTAANPVLAHRFIDFMLDPANAKSNFEFVGFQPAVASPSAFELVSGGTVPEHLLSTLVYDADVAVGYRIDPISPSVSALWDASWQRVTGG